MNSKYSVSLTEAEQRELDGLIHSGSCPARQQNRARVLILCDRRNSSPLSDQEIADRAMVSRATVANIRRRYTTAGVEGALAEIAAGVFEHIVHDLRAVLRLAMGRNAHPTAAIFDGQTIQSTPESGERSAYDGHKKRKISKIHIEVDTLGHLLAITVTPANAQERVQVSELSKAVQAATGNHVTMAFVDQGYTGDAAAQAAEAEGITLNVVKLPEAKRGFVLLPRRWVIERSFAWKSRFRRLIRDYERMPETVKGLHFLSFAILMLANYVQVLKST